MRIKLLIIFSAFICVSGFSKKNHLNESGKKLYKNINGYEVTFRSCDTISFNDADEAETPVEKLNDVLAKTGCPDDSGKRAFGVSMQIIASSSEPKVYFKKLKYAAFLSSKQARVDDTLYISSEESEKKYNVGFFSIRHIGKTYIRWMIYKNCGNKVFQIQIDTENNDPANRKLIENIKSGKELIPEPERSFIESFKCIN